jgi:hypothetical protein
MSENQVGLSKWRVKLTPEPSPVPAEHVAPVSRLAPARKAHWEEMESDLLLVQTGSAPNPESGSGAGAARPVDKVQAKNAAVI